MINLFCLLLRKDEYLNEYLNEYLRYMYEMDIYKISNAISFWACFIEIQIKSHILLT